MHNAPPVVYPVGRCVWARAAFMVVCGLSALGLILWSMQAQTDTALLWAAWLFWALCTAFAAWFAPKQALTGGRLGWTGEAWFWQQTGCAMPDAQAVSVMVGLDTGHGLLLWIRFLDEQGAARGQLVNAWVQADAMPSKWHGFRCAVYSRPKTSPLARGARLDR